MARRKPTRLLIVVGTRPEAIKLAPVILEARRLPAWFDTRVVATGQHRHMLDQVLALFDIRPDLDLGIMSHDQSLCHVTTEALKGLCRAVESMEPDCVVVQGDTTTAFAGALAAFYVRVPVAHVEAGLRTYDRREPFPEEINRRLISHIADYHFAPTAVARENLLAEGISPERIWVTGNTGVDALLLTRDRHRATTTVDRPRGPLVLVTAHRRENQGAPLVRICQALLSLLAMFPDLHVLYPVHPNPRVRVPVFALLGAHPRVRLTDPLDYREFVLAMDRADVILTDSGGIQEEAPSLQKPVLVLRKTTERPEAIEAGAARLVGTDPQRIVQETAALLRDPARGQAATGTVNPYGDGNATLRILDVLATIRAQRRAACPWRAA
jgi:UDP-N-acetylglucosamine 2-epimerase (non-hydrolysing)